MKLRLVVLAIFALVLTLLVPATADASGGGDNWWQQQCPQGFDGPDKEGNCTRITTEDFDAEKIVHYYCEAPYSGPSKDNQCVKHDVDSFPADKVYDYKCPDGYDGPVGKLCTKTVTSTDTVHVNEESSQICPDGWNLATDVCTFTVPNIEKTPGTTVQELSCPDDYAGPNAAGGCTKTTVEIDVKPANVTTVEVCPNGFTLQSANCVKSVTEKRFAGVNVVTDLACATGLTFESAGCVAKVPAKTTYTCPTDYTLNTAAPILFPGQCEKESEVKPVIYGLECPATLNGETTTVTNLFEFMPGMGTCDAVSAPHDVVTFACPSGSVLVAGSTTLCERDISTTISVPPISIDQKSCDDAGYVGPGINDECTKTTIVEDDMPALPTAVIVCSGATVGPDANGDCLIVSTIALTTPPIDLPSFTCPGGYDGPDEKWNCTKTTTKVEEVDAEKVVKGYQCPADARGPNKDNLCSRDTVVKVDASEEISYVCPKDTHGAKDGKCTRKTVEVVPAHGRNCTVKFYDYPHAQKFLFSVSDDGQANLDGKLAQYNNDVESVKVSSGCTVSVAQKFNNSTGWCMTFGPGVHNVPDDQLSWYSLPGTGCKNW